MAALLISSCANEKDIKSFPDFRRSPLVITEAQTAALREQLPPEQWEYVADGQLTFAEYEAAFFDMVACLGTLHVTVQGAPTLTPRGRYQALLRADPTLVPAVPESARETTAAMLSCRQRYFDGLDLMWAVHFAPSERELQAARDRLGECMRDGGVSDVPEHPGTDYFARFIGSNHPVYQPCAGAAGEALGIPGWGG